MQYYWEALCSPQTWLYSVIMTVGVVGLAKSWMRLKKKRSERLGAQVKETTDTK